MLFRQLFDVASSTYTYLLADAHQREAVLIDPVYEQHDRDAALIRELGLTLTVTLDTHCHADHVTGAWLMHKAFGSRIGLAATYGAENVDLPLMNGDRVRFGRHTLEVRATPGHTDGCLSFYCSAMGAVFTGDALLIRGAGRTDFQQGDAHTLFHSIQTRIFSLPDDTLIYPGHDYQGRTVSTVEEEKRFNPRAGGGANETDFVGYMDNLRLPHPRRLEIALPANLRCGEPETEPEARPTWGPVVLSYGGVPEIVPYWVAGHRDRVHLLDVRQEEEVDHDKLPGVLHIPLATLRQRASEIPSDKPVVTLCRSGRRSAMAVSILKETGRSDVANVAGGLLRWREEGLPL